MITYITNALKNHRNRSWFGVPEAMDYTKCSRTTIYSAVRSGKLKSSKTRVVCIIGILLFNDVFTSEGFTFLPSRLPPT